MTGQRDNDSDTAHTPAMTTMTWEEAAAAIAATEAARAAEYEARRNAITPHLRRPIDRTKTSKRAGASPHNRVPLGAGSSTYCGAEMTTEDLDRRNMASWLKKAPVEATTRGVCPICLQLAGLTGGPAS